MSFTTFRTYWISTGPRVAYHLALANGITKAQAQLWILQLTKGEQA